MKRVAVAFIFLALITVLFTGCAGAASSSSDTKNAVHMDDMNFLPGTITINKGDSITLTDDVSTIHIIANGMWDNNGTPRPKYETGAPKVDNVQFNGGDNHAIGPFNTPGTYHFYCTVHPNMNLTVTVK